MKQVLIVISIFTLTSMMTSCGKDECQTCTVEQTLTEDGVVQPTTELTASKEYCGAALDVVKALENTMTQDFDGAEIITRTTVTCN